MFYIVCASTPQSSVRIGCPGPIEAQAKVVELEETGVGKVRIFDDAGNRVSEEELSNLITAAAAKSAPQ